MDYKPCPKCGSNVLKVAHSYFGGNLIISCHRCKFVADSTAWQESDRIGGHKLFSFAHGENLLKELEELKKENAELIIENMELRIKLKEKSDDR